MSGDHTTLSWKHAEAASGDEGDRIGREERKEKAPDIDPLSEQWAKVSET
jgi:hypothetical protein